MKGNFCGFHSFFVVFSYPLIHGSVFHDMANHEAIPVECNGELFSSKRDLLYAALH